MAKTRYKPEELTQQGEPEVAVLPSEQPVSPFLDPSVAQAEPQGSELYNLGTVQQRAASTRDADMYMPSYLQAPRNYPTGAEGGATRPEGASPMLYPSQAETQPRVRARYKPEEALAIAEANRPKRYSPDQMLDVAAESMFDASQQPLPKELWKAATQRRAEMVKDGRLPMEFGQIDSLKDGIVWAANSLYGVGSYLASAPIAAAASYASSPIESQRQMHATAAATVKRLSTEFGLQTYQDIFNLTHEPKYRVKETGQFVAVNKTGLPLMLPAASGGNNVISGDGIISPVTPEASIRQFAKEGMTLVPTTEQDLEDYRYGQYLDRMGIGAQSIEDMKAKAPPELVAALVSGNWDSVEPNQAQTELALLAAQAAIPVGGSARTWGVGRRVAAGISKAAEKVEAVAGFPVDVDTALRANFVKAVTSGTGADAVAQKTAMQAAIDAGKTTAKVGGAYGVAAGVSSFDGTPSEIKDLAWTAANLYTGYKSSMYVARQLRAASGFTKTVLKEVADPSRGLDAGARAAVAANPAVPQSVREVLESPSRYRALESTPARLAKNPELSPTSRAVFDKLSDYRFVQAARLTRDAAAGVPKGITLNAPFIAGALASDDPERAGQMIAAGGLFGAVGGTASRFTEANMRRGEEATSDIARMLVDIQAGNELGSGLGGEIMRNRVRPGTKFQDGERGFVMPEQEVASFLTEMEMAGADVAAFVQGKSFDELAQWAAYQGFFRDKVDLVPLNARDYKLNAEANGHSGAGAYFMQPSEGRRARIFVNAESRRNGLAPHEYGHAVLRGGALSPDQIDAVHADINGRYTPDALKAMAGEYAASMVRAENVKAGIDIDPSPAAIEAKVTELTQGSMIKGSADGLDWLREEIFAEEFRNANIDLSRARRNIPLGANPVSFMENLLGAQSRALHMAGIDIDPQTGKPMGRDQIFKENRVAAGDPVVMKNYEAYVKQWRQWIKDPTHEADPGVAVSKTGNVQDTANNPNVTWRDYGGGRMENEFGVKNPDGTVTPKDWNEDIKPTVRARQQAVREMSNRSKQVASADDPTFGMRTRRDGRKEVSGRVLPDSFFYIPQYKPFHSDIRKIVTADGAGETLQVRFFAKGKSKDVFKDGVNGVNAVNREAMHGNFVAKKDGTLMWGWLDMTQFRNRAMKAIADRNPALEPYNWDFKALMDDLPTHLRDQASGRGGAVTVGPERANVLNGLIGIGTGPLVGAFGKGTAYKTIHLDSIDAVVPTGKQGGQFDVYRANRNAMPDDPKPPVDMTTDLTPDNNNRMPSALPQAGMAMPDAPVRGERADIPLNPRARRAAFISDRGEVRSTGRATHFETNEDLGPDFLAIGAGHLGEDGFFRFGSQTMDDAMGESPATSSAAAARYNQSVYDQGKRPSAMLEEPPGLERPAMRGQAMADVGSPENQPKAGPTDQQTMIQRNPAGDYEPLGMLRKQPNGKWAVYTAPMMATNKDGTQTMLPPSKLAEYPNEAKARARAEKEFFTSLPLQDAKQYLGPREQKAITEAQRRIAEVAKNNPEAARLEVTRDDRGLPKVGLIEDADGNPVLDERGNQKFGAIYRKAKYGLREAPGLSNDEARAVQQAADLMEADARRGQANPAIAKGIGWYGRMRGWLQQAYGATIEMFGQLLGATSARTPVDTNFIQAREALQIFGRGGYDDLLSRFDAFVMQKKADADSGKMEADWRKKGGKGTFKLQDEYRKQVNSFKEVPLRANGKKYNANSTKVLHALYGNWIAQTKGPKTPNFAGNLTGRTFKATIDVWAARNLRRLLYQGKAKRWRILPEQEQGVADVDFFFGQKVYDEVGRRMGIPTDDLQALQWFNEKDIWETNDWTDKTGAEKSSFDKEAGKLNVDRYQIGLTTFQDEAGFDPAVQRAELVAFRDSVRAQEGLEAARVTESEGLYGNVIEPTFDAEFSVSRKGEVSPSIEPIIRQAIDTANRNKQNDVFISAVVDETHPNARPMVEVGFKSAANRAEIDAVTAVFRGAGIDGFTVARNERGDVLGIRAQYVPEISARYDTPDHLDPVKFGQNAATWAANARKAIANISGQDNVSYRKEGYVSTNVYGIEEYGSVKPADILRSNARTELGRRRAILAAGTR